MFVYGKTDCLSLFWNNSPVPDLGSLTSTNSLDFFAVYIMSFIGSAVKNSGAKLSSRLVKTGEQIEDQLMEDQIKGVSSRLRAEIRSTLSIPDYSSFRQLLWEVITFVISIGLMFCFYKMFGF
ncbi:YniB family protein [Plesiomonas shigelloides]|uniref:YniB family protein n=1 Tax=Plesiomonas shigelloides TaxID=703 RepID=UPI002E2F2D53|nr:YniB family protein [Plesiomonas shigelloides]